MKQNKLQVLAKKKLYNVNLVLTWWRRWSGGGGLCMTKEDHQEMGIQEQQPKTVEGKATNFFFFEGNVLWLIGLVI